MKEFEPYQRKTIYAKVGQYCALSKDHDFIEVCEWGNGEGFDITINENQLQITWGQFKLLKKLVKQLQK